MSKVFEEEYKRLAQDDIPDLWERIEAGLSEKTVESTSAPKIKIVTFRKYAGLIAACLCAAVVIPTAVNMGRSSKNMEAPAYDMAAPASEEAELQPASDMAVPADEEADLQFAENQLTGDMTGAAKIETESAAEQSEVMEADLEVKKQSASEESKSILTDGMIIREVSLEITAVEEMANTTVYTATVQKDPNGLWTQGEKITFTKGLYVEEELIPGESYQVNLHYYADETYTFEVSKIIK